LKNDPNELELLHRDLLVPISRENGELLRQKISADKFIGKKNYSSLKKKTQKYENY